MSKLILVVGILMPIILIVLVTLTFTEYISPLWIPIVLGIAVIVITMVAYTDFILYLYKMAKDKHDKR